jgi:hypothetical protein
VTVLLGGFQNPHDSGVLIRNIEIGTRIAEDLSAGEFEGPAIIQRRLVSIFGSAALCISGMTAPHRYDIASAHRPASGTANGN